MPKTCIKRLGILTGGGDCPGLNAVIRAVAKTAQSIYNIEVIGILDSYWGLVAEKFRPLSNRDVSGILGIGGTILGTSRVNPFVEAHKQGRIASPEENWGFVQDILQKHRIDAIVAVGGDGTLQVASRAAQAGISIVGVPKTIDNDVCETDVTFGFNSAVTIIMEALDRLHTTAMSHQRAMVVEVMGRTAGWLALHAGVAGGGDILLLPEIPFEEEVVFERVRERGNQGKRFSIIVVAEGARPSDQQAIYTSKKDASGRAILGGIGEYLTDRIQTATGISSRVTVLGHLQRGGSPTAFDRILATQFGHHAVEALIEGCSGQMVATQKGKIVTVPLESAIARTKLVEPSDPLIDAARSVGTSFGVK